MATLNPQVGRTYRLDDGWIKVDRLAVADKGADDGRTGEPTVVGRFYDEDYGDTYTRQPYVWQLLEECQWVPPQVRAALEG